MYRYKAQLSRVVDGDTVYLRVDLGFHVHMELDFRLLGVNTPEVRGSEKVAGLEAKAELQRLLELGEIEVQSSKVGKYGRWLGQIYVNLPDGSCVDVNQHLLDAGFADPYLKG